MEKRILGSGTLGKLEVSALGFGCMGMSQSFGPNPGDRAPDDRPAAHRRRARRHVLRHRGGLRPLRQRGARRRGPRPGARPGRHRHQVRLRVRRPGPPDRAVQPPRPHPPGGRRVAAPARHRHHRPALPAPRRPAGADRGRRRHRQGARRGREGPPLRDVRGRRAHHPPRARRAPGHRAAERVLAVLARARSRDHPDAGGARHRAGAVQPARPGLPHRAGIDQTTTFGEGDIRATLPRFTAEARQANQALVDLLGRDRRATRAPRPRRSRWPGCSPSGRGSSPSPAPAGSSGSRRTSAPPTST